MATMVHQRNLGSNGPLVSAMGLGCMRMSGAVGRRPGGSDEDEQESIATIRAALDAGINLLDTGDFYGMGHNELLVRDAIVGRRDQAFLSVKFGAQRSPSGDFLGPDLRAKSVKNYAAYSLQRLKVDYIDLYQPGRLDPSIPVEETVGAVADLIREGKVRYLGLSEVNAKQLREAHSVHPVSALQIEYSLATRFIEDAILPTARELGISIVAYNVTAQRLLTGVPAEAMQAARGALRQNLQTVATLDLMADAKGCTPAQLAIAWILSRGNDVVPIVGMSRRTRLDENLGALSVPLSEEESALLDRAFAPGTIASQRGSSEVRHLSPS
jgi:aryl-alcohol dehydrogenase-like predicted oxidoreductase